MELSPIKACEEDILVVGVDSNEFEDEEMPMDEDALLNEDRETQDPVSDSLTADTSQTSKALSIGSSSAEGQLTETCEEERESRSKDDSHNAQTRQDESYRSRSNGAHSYSLDGYYDQKKLFKHLHVTRSSDPGIVGRELAYRLNELKSRLLGEVVRVLGVDTAIEIFEETKHVLKSGGLLTDDAQRKRTPGGTYLYLMKARGYADAEQIREIFKEEQSKHKKHKKRQAKKRADKQVARMADKLGLRKAESNSKSSSNGTATIESNGTSDNIKQSCSADAENL